MAGDGCTLEIRGRRYTMDELNAAWRAGNDAGEGFADDGLRAGDTPRWQAERDDEVSVIERGRDVLLVDATGWAVRLGGG